jgi:transcriptional regulator with XRE-family HTH domain
MQTAKAPARPDLPIRDFGNLLRHWRQTRRLSQLELATEAMVSAKHLCFLETGRSQPSREMVQLLGNTLDLPLNEQNALHLAAGYAAPYGERTLGALDLEHVRYALEFILRQQEPFPGLVIDGRWDIRLRNEASRRLFRPFHQAYEIDEALAGNAMHVSFHPKALRPFIVNWPEFAGGLIQILHREVAQGTNAAAAGLLNEILAYPDLPSGWKVPHGEANAAPVLPMHLRKDDLDLSFFTTLTTFAMPRDVALQQLKIECFYPADSKTAEVARRLAE